MLYRYGCFVLESLGTLFCINGGNVLMLQDHPSSDSFYDSDFADTETAAIGGEKVEKEEVEMPVADTYENPEVDGEWGRQLFPFLLLLHTH